MNFTSGEVNYGLYKLHCVPFHCFTKSGMTQKILLSVPFTLSFYTYFFSHEGKRPGNEKFAMGQKLHQLTDFQITVHRTQVHTSTANIYRPDVSYKVKYNFLVSDILYLGPTFLKALQACLRIILILVPMMLL